MKKYLTLFIAFLLCVSLCTGITMVSAAEQNLVPKGSFNNEDDVSIFIQGNTKTVKWSEESATKTPGSAQHTIINSGLAAGIELMTLAGETYDITFYAKCTGLATGIIMYASFKDGGYVSLSLKDSSLTTDWRKYECTFFVSKSPLLSSVIECFKASMACDTFPILR